MDTLDRKKGARCRDGEAPTIHELSEKRMTSAKRPPKNPRLLRTPELPTGCLQPPLMALPRSHSARSSARQTTLFTPLSSLAFYETTPVKGFPGGSAGKDSACNVGDPGSIPESGRAPGGGNSYPLQYSGLENSKGLQRVRHD